MFDKLSEVLYEDGWKGMLLEFTLFLIMTAASLMVIKLLNLNSGSLGGFGFIIGMVISDIHHKRIYIRINKIANQIREESKNG